MRLAKFHFTLLRKMSLARLQRGSEWRCGSTHFFLGFGWWRVVCFASLVLYPRGNANLCATNWNL